MNQFENLKGAVIVSTGLLLGEIAYRGSVEAEQAKAANVPEIHRTPAEMQIQGGETQLKLDNSATAELGSVVVYSLAEVQMESAQVDKR